jgi:septal ring factor EnvC (AmiA/AmiB activator)
MADKKAVGHAYNVDFLNVVFAASSIFLFLSVVWMVWDDFDRDWKNTQRRFAQLEYQVTQAAQKQAAGAIDKNKIAQYEATKKASQAQIKANQAKVDELNKKLAEADKNLFTATLDYNYMKATYDQDRYDFETSRVADPNASSTK